MLLNKYITMFTRPDLGRSYNMDVITTDVR